MRFLVAGGAGFMGSNLVRYLISAHEDAEVLVYDKLTYAGRLENLRGFEGDPRFRFERGDICDGEQLCRVISSYRPDVIVNLAAETHVDRSIRDPEPFIRTNVVGTFALLEAARKLDVPLLIHVSTDEVYGDIGDGPPSAEDSSFKPSSPYSASKAAGDLLCQAYWRTYRLPVRIVRPSNNYGPYQYPEKLIPRVILRAVHNLPIPIYGSGRQVRDWLHVEDFCRALDVVMKRGSNGEAYNVPGFNERTNLEVVEAILDILDKPRSLIRFVADRPGHDTRYAMKGDKILALGWRPQVPWLEGLRRTVQWYLENEWWWRPLLSDSFFSSDIPWG